MLFYRHLESFWYFQLVGRQAPPMQLPVVGSDAISQTLVAISDVDSPLHDGFHFVDCRTRALTHLSQFVGLPRPAKLDFPSSEWPSGARQATALMASRLPGIECVGLIQGNGRLSVYANGSARHEESP